MDFNSVYQNYYAELDQVEHILHERAVSRHKILSAANNQLIDAGGKRLRPLFALICGTVSRRSEATSLRVAKVAAALELTHMATLVHDDVIDGADLRRGKPTVRSEHGNLAAMYTGDFLFGRAIQLLAEVDDERVHQPMALGMVRLCQGEVEQIRDFFNWDQSIRTYLRRIERKTALLIALSCSLGARVGGASDVDVNVLRLFGHYTGMAFQIIDDLLDFTGSVQVVGKPVGGDLRQGNITLPALIAAQNNRTGERLRQLVQAGMPNDAADEAIRLITESDGLSVARTFAEKYLKKALSVLRRVSESRVQQELGVLTRFVAERAF
ncbi:polyprenyl synthetase family protein [Alicyclobacillus dauci]|uniref:Polyprenyl synthetase family protein n=1 Tax=Alicyclobacillus dauci TaxID=1475485 RepID=A0ABY6YX74_9BACL|nr:polyprenyl synthetase family protein [Alicyclobacillus dauci]WAH35101.1 polyprenyl synthetase family protein [Alicyclobacillus dauci]